MLFKGKSSKLELLIEKIQSTRESPQKDVSVGACSSLWEGGSEEGGGGGGRGSLSGTPTSSEEGGRDPLSSGTPTPDADVEAASTVGVTETTPYQCSFCELAFPRLSYLKRHEQNHSDQLPFRCDFCGRHFKHKRSRDRHVKLHTGDKKYKCTSCEAAFSRSDHLKIHLKTHDTQKPHRCTTCTRGYSTAAALTAHMQNHKARGAPPTPLDHILKDVGGAAGGIGGCDPALISRLIQDSAGGVSRQEKGALKSQNLSSETGVNHNNNNTNTSTSTASPLRPTTHSPPSVVRCPLCHVQCKSHTQLQHHMSRHHNDERSASSGGGLPLCPPQDRPSSTSNHSASSSFGNRTDTFLQERPPSTSSLGGGVGGGGRGTEASPTASSPTSRPASAVTSPRPMTLPSSNPFFALAGGKLTCPFCSCDGFPSFEAFQLHIQSVHGSSMNNELLGGLPSSLSSYRSGGGLFSPLFSSLGAAGSSRQVTCELCGARVNGVTALQRHVITAHSFTDLLARAAEGVFCAQCLLPFSNPGALAEHIKLLHTAPAPSLAPTLSLLSGVLSKRPLSPLRDKPTDLSKKPRRDTNLRDVSMRDLPSSTLLCSQCDAPFGDFESFRAHLKTHLDGTEHGGTYACPECQAHVGTEAALATHLASHLEATVMEYGCHACIKTFSKPDELQKHLLDMHAHHLYRCALCRQVFDSKVSIQVHFAVKHSNETKMHKCLKCSIKFRTQNEFDSHLRESHLQGREIFMNHNGLIPPSSNDSNALSPKPKLNAGSSGGIGSSGGGFRCLLCPMALSTEMEMSAHLATHERQFRCSLCDEAFHVEFLLDRHMQSMHVTELNGSHSESHLKTHGSDPSICMSSIDLRCGICDTHFPSESSLNIHRKQAHSIKCPTNKVAAATLSLFCAYCNEVCKSRNDLEAHMKSSHGGASSGRHKCNICDEIFPSAPSLAHHKLSHVKVLSGSAYCVVCREQLTSPEHVKAHQRDHYQKPLPQPCVVCRQTLVAEVEVKVHARFHASLSTPSAELENDFLHQQPCGSNELSSNNNGSRLSLLKCPDCLLKFENLEDLHSHACHERPDTREKSESKEKMDQWNSTSKMEEVNYKMEKEKLENPEVNGKNNARTYQCIKCQESFASESAIEAHVTSHLEQEGSSHLCHLCRSYFDTPLRLQCHLIEHTFEGCGSFTCYLCASVFTTAARLQQHMVTHGLSAKPYDCHHCRQSFFFRSELENHLPTHAEAADGCRDCQATFPSGVRTRPTSAENIGINCHLCSFVAHSLGELHSHSLLHRSSRSEGASTPRSLSNQTASPPENETTPQTCKTCSRKCRNGMSLHLHNLTHEGGKPYLCGECGAAFTRRCEAARHSSIHRDQATPTCIICNKEFPSASEVLSHVRKSHGGPDVEAVRPDSRCSSCDGEMDSSDSSLNPP